MNIGITAHCQPALISLHCGLHCNIVNVLFLSSFAVQCVYVCVDLSRSEHLNKHSPPQGCFRHILKTLKEHANIVGGIAAGIGVLEVKKHEKEMGTFCVLKDGASVHNEERMQWISQPCANQRSTWFGVNAA